LRESNGNTPGVELNAPTIRFRKLIEPYSQPPFT
jgi:hypothetical protein